MVVTLSFGYFVPDPTTNYYYLDLVVTIKSKNIDPPNVDTENWRFHPKWIFYRVFKAYILERKNYHFM
jgi:hypothetical protein